MKEYVDTNYELIKLEVIEYSSVISAGIISTLIVGVVLVFFSFFINLYDSYYLSYQLEESYMGFAIAGAFYLFLAIIIYLNKKKLIEQQEVTIDKQKKFQILL